MKKSYMSALFLGTAGLVCAQETIWHKDINSHQDFIYQTTTTIGQQYLNKQ